MTSGRSKHNPAQISKKGKSKHSPTAFLTNVKNAMMKRISPTQKKSRGQPQFPFDDDSRFNAKWERERNNADKLKEAVAKDRQKGKNYAALITKLRKEGYTIRRVAGDGDCAPLSITDDMPDVTDGELRQMVAAHMIRYPQGFIQAVLGTTNGSNYSIAGYKAVVSKILNDGEWFDEPQVAASAIVLARDICVHTPNYEERWYRSGTSNTPIELIYNGDNHYDRVYAPGDDMVSFSLPFIIINIPLGVY